MANTKKALTYDYICFTNLAYEFQTSDSREIEEKIKKRLKYYKLGPFVQERIDLIRCLRNDLYSEITKYNKSKYFYKSTEKFADPNDFNFELLLYDYLDKYPNINREDMGAIINFAIYLFYLR